MGKDDFNGEEYNDIQKYLSLYIHLGYDFKNYELDIEKSNL